MPQEVQCAKCHHFHGDQPVGSEPIVEPSEEAGKNVENGQNPEGQSLPFEPSLDRPQTPPSPDEGTSLLPSSPNPESSEIQKAQCSNNKADSNIRDETSSPQNLDVNVPNNVTSVRSCEQSSAAKSASVPNFSESTRQTDDETFVVIEAKSRSDPGNGTIGETSFIRKGIQELISRANQSSLKRAPAKTQSKGFTKGSSKKPGGAYRIVPTSPSKADSMLESDAESLCSLNDYEVVSDLATEEPVPSTSRLTPCHCDEEDSSDLKPSSCLERSLSVDSAKLPTKTSPVGVETASDSLDALNLSPSKKKKRKITVPYRMTSDGTKINFLCDVSMYCSFYVLNYIYCRLDLSKCRINLYFRFKYIVVPRSSYPAVVLRNGTLKSFGSHSTMSF